MLDFILIFTVGIFVGLMGSTTGGSGFIALPFLQSIYPGIWYGTLIGNFKAGNLFRGVTSTLQTIDKIEYRKNLPIIIPLILSSIAGTVLIALLKEEFIIYGVLSAILISELAPKIAHLINRKTRIIFSIFVGFYSGLIGVGSAIMIVALMRTVYTQESQIILAKIQARFIETVATVFVVALHLYYGNILTPFWLIWGSGMAIGGLLGGRILKNSLKLSPRFQKIFLYIVYIVALLPFIV